MYVYDRSIASCRDTVAYGKAYRVFHLFRLTLAAGKPQAQSLIFASQRFSCAHFVEMRLAHGLQRRP